VRNPPPHPGQATDVVSAMDTEISIHGTDVRKILRRLVHFEHPRHDETRTYVTKECGGVIKFPLGLGLGSGAKPQTLTVFFVFFWHNEPHSRIQNANYWRLVAG